MLNHKYPNEIIKAIRADEPGVFDAVDRMYRKAFIQQAKYRFPATPGDIEDGWQDAMIDFYQGIKSEKITEITCTLRFFLFRIGENKLMKIYGKRKRFSFFDNIVNFFLKNPEIDEPFIEIIMDDHDNEILKKGMEQISQRCRDLLNQRYFHKKSISELKEIFQYANENTVSVTIYNCLRNLKEAIEKLEKGE